jgi:hypothetical protein
VVVSRNRGGGIDGAARSLRRRVALQEVGGSGYARYAPSEWPRASMPGKGSSDLMLDQWANFFVMVGGGAAALAGLIFVAMSIKPEVIIQNSTHKNRAINMLTGFSAVFMASSFALIGNQSLGVLGIEWLLLWLIATVVFVRGYVIAIRSGMSSIGLNTPRLAGGTMCYLAEVTGAILLIFGYGAGLYVAAVASIVLFAFLISGAWLLIIGVYEDPTK